MRLVRQAYMAFKLLGKKFTQGFSAEPTEIVQDRNLQNSEI